ncbi:6381_t:CDS:2, partial [Cetraspora pellucida]
MSSYKSDNETGLSILYLQDTKASLWKKFSELFPNKDLGGLCLICNECGYKVFADIEDLIENYKQLKVQAQVLRHYLRRDFAKELDIDLLEKKKLGTIYGISNWHEFTWPEIEEETEYIYTRALPEFGKWNKIAPGQVDKIAKKHIFKKPSPSYTTHTQSSKSWSIPIVSKKGYLALPESLKANQKEPVKRITEQVKELLTIMFYTGTANSRLKMNASEMHEELMKKVSEGESSKDDVLK